MQRLRAGSGAIALFAWLGLLAGIVGSLGACGSGDTERGPMRFGDGWVSGCAPARLYDHMVFQQFLRVPDQDAVVTSVETVDAVDLDVRRYVMLVNPPKVSVGFVEYPPKSPAWKKVVPAEGAKLPADAPAYLIVEVQTTAKSGGHMAGSRIHYSIGDDEYVATTHNTLEIGKCND